MISLKDALRRRMNSINLLPPPPSFLPLPYSNHFSPTFLLSSPSPSRPSPPPPPPPLFLSCTSTPYLLCSFPPPPRPTSFIPLLQFHSPPPLFLSSTSPPHHPPTSPPSTTSSPLPRPGPIPPGRGCPAKVRRCQPVPQYGEYVRRARCTRDAAHVALGIHSHALCWSSAARRPSPFKKTHTHTLAQNIHIYDLVNSLCIICMQIFIIFYR